MTQCVTHGLKWRGFGNTQTFWHQSMELDQKGNAPAELLEGEVLGVLLHLGEVDVNEVPWLALLLPLLLLLLGHTEDEDDNTKMKMTTPEKVVEDPLLSFWSLFQTVGYIRGIVYINYIKLGQIDINDNDNGWMNKMWQRTLSFVETSDSANRGTCPPEIRIWGAFSSTQLVLLLLFGSILT